MNRLLLSCCLLTSSLLSNCQKDGFGIVNFVVPEGYGLIKNDNVLTYYKEDKTTGAYCNFFVYGLISGKGGVQQDFDFAWMNQVQKPFKVTGVADLQPVAVLKGWKFLIGTKRYADEGTATLAMLITFSGGNSMQSICVLSNSDRYKSDIEQFISSVDVVKEMGRSDGSVNTNSSSDAANKVPVKPETVVSPAVKNIPYEVWECNCPNLAAGTQVMTKLTTVVISPDGKYLSYMPEQGLNGVTPENSNETGSWGNLTDKGKSWSLVNDKYGKMELYKIDANTRSRYPNSKSSIYKKVRPVDGLRVEGAYSPEISYYNGRGNVISNQIDPRKRPIIFFRKDGTYINEGISFSNITRGDDFAIGSGTYKIVNYSLILTTQSGKELQVAFTGVLDANPAATDNGGLIINNSLFYRLNKSFAPH